MKQSRIDREKFRQAYALEFQKHKYDETSLKHLVDIWVKTDKVKIILK